MTVVPVNFESLYIGVAADTKPSAPPPGSRFYATDTGAWYIFDGSAWQTLTSPTVATITGDVEIGAVELKDGATDTRAKVGAGSGLVTGDNALAVANPTGGILTGALTETAPASDTASSGLNGRLQRIAQNITALIAALAAKITVIIAGAGGTAIGLDNTNEAKASVYGKASAAGDTAVLLSAAGRVQVVGGAQVADGVVANPAGFFSNDDQGRSLAASQYLFNPGASGANDRARANGELILLASAARTALINSSDQVNYNARGVIVTVDITAYTSGTLTCTIKYKDSLSGKYITQLASAALAAAATTQLTVYPGVTVAANGAVSQPLPRVWRVEMTVGDATSITYSVSANLIN